MTLLTTFNGALIDGTPLPRRVTFAPMKTFVNRPSPDFDEIPLLASFFQTLVRETRHSFQHQTNRVGQ